MKKIYASMLAVACATCITASADAVFTPVNTPVAKQELTTTKLRSAKFENFTVAESKVQDTQKRAASRADEWVALGTGFFNDGLFSGAGEYEVEIQQNAENPNLYRILNAWSHLVGGETEPLEFDVTNPECVNIPLQDTGLSMGADGPVQVISASAYLASYGYTEEEMIESFPDAMITFAQGAVMIPVGSFMIYLPESEEYGEEPILFNDSEDSYILLPGSPVPSMWSAPKVGTMLDGFFEPAFVGYEPEEVEVYIQKSNWYEGVYRVLNPWELLRGEPYGGILTIDASNPDCVVVPLQSSDISTGSVDEGGRGMTYLMSWSYNSESIEDFLASEDADYNITMDTEAQRINFPVVKTIYQNGSSGNVTCIFAYWPDYNQNGLYYIEGVDGYIQLPDFNDSITDVSVDNEDLSVRPVFYNIQGMQIDNPKAGQIVIVKKGNKVVKTIMR